MHYLAGFCVRMSMVDNNGCPFNMRVTDLKTLLADASHLEMWVMGGKNRRIVISMSASGSPYACTLTYASLCEDPKNRRWEYSGSAPTDQLKDNCLYIKDLLENPDKEFANLDINHAPYERVSREIKDFWAARAV